MKVIAVFVAVLAVASASPFVARPSPISYVGDAIVERPVPEVQSFLRPQPTAAAAPISTVASAAVPSNEPLVQIILNIQKTSEDYTVIHPTTVVGSLEPEATSAAIVRPTPIAGAVGSIAPSIAIAPAPIPQELQIESLLPVEALPPSMSQFEGLLM